MKISNQYKRMLCADIKVDRTDRDRKVIDTSDIDVSIKARGVLQPIIVDRDGNLIAGERRLTSSIKVGHPDIPVRFVDELTPLERKLIELEENLKRQALPWRDEVRAIGRIHSIYGELNQDWSQEQTAKELGIATGTMSRTLRVFTDIDSPKIATAENFSTAYNILMRFDERKMNNVVSDLVDIGDDIFKDDPVPVVSPSPAPIGPTNPGKPSPISSNANPLPPPPPKPKFPDSIIQGDFVEWARNYRGPKFNFIHCDFPYGIGVFAGPQSGKDRQDTYSDNPEDYWTLIEAFCKYRNNFLSASAHLMFWFSMDYYRETLDAFRQYAPDLDFQLHPLYWLKTDNVGIVPDAKRGPRRIVETALIASREDRLIVRPKNNGYAAPTDKLYHTSAKPEPVLRHFFEMFVDENTTMLDPTCGSGSSLRAAESLGARTVIGIERDPTHFNSAVEALRNFRVLREASRKVG